MFNFYLERNTELHEQILLCLGIAMNLFIVALSNPFWPQTLICTVDFPRMSGCDWGAPTPAMFTM